jgi:hypothetical protein
MSPGVRTLLDQYDRLGSRDQEQVQEFLRVAIKSDLLRKATPGGRDSIAASAGNSAMDASTAPHPISRNASEKMSDDQLFVERRPQGDYAMRKGNSQRASAVEPTQAAAIEKARQLNPGKAPLVERVRNTTGGSPDK